jgi:hypothetical protein
VGRHGAGTVFQRGSDGRWVGAYMDNERRRFVYAATEAEARQRLAIRQSQVRPKAIRTAGRAALGVVIERHLEWAEREGWDRRQTARVMAAGMSGLRLRFGIVGPCVYCGSIYADTVDHVIPRSRGGTDDQANLVSACLAVRMTHEVFRVSNSPYRELHAERP